MTESAYGAISPYIGPSPNEARVQSAIVLIIGKYRLVWLSTWLLDTACGPNGVVQNTNMTIAKFIVVDEYYFKYK